MKQLRGSLQHRCLSIKDPWGTYLSMHLSRRTTWPFIIVTIMAAIRPSKYNIHRGARYDPRNSTSSYHNHVSDTMQMTCSNEKWGDNHFYNKAQFAARNTTLTNKQQVSKSFSTPHKEIHEFHMLNKNLEIHLPQFIEQSLRDFSFPLSLNF